MSYEGYVERLCAAGHLRLFDAYADADDTQGCGSGEPFVFRHDVDETNCNGVRFQFEVAEPAITAICSLGHVHILHEARYKIPPPAGAPKS